MITWGDVIDIIVWSFTIKQKDLARLLCCDETVISKVRNGRQPFSCANEFIFSAVFNPASSGSPAQVWGDKPKSCLRHLKEEIEAKFKEVRESMDDYWEEEDYRKFVMAMLGRARQGAPSKKEPHHSDQSKKAAIAADVGPSEDCHEKQKKVSRQETPSEQMSTIFEQAVADFNIASYICKLPDYLLGEPFYAGDTFDFINTIQTDVLGKFVNQQNENIFKKISDFRDLLDTYSVFLGLIQASISEEYGTLWKMGGSYNEIFCLIDDNYSKAKAELQKELSSGKNSSNEFLMEKAESNLNQLDFLRSILLAYKQICELYSEICSGKTLLVF